MRNKVNTNRGKTNFLVELCPLPSPRMSKEPLERASFVTVAPVTPLTLSFGLPDGQYGELATLNAVF